jgi:signal transduction histidine kinase
MVAWADRLRKAVRGDLHILDAHERLEFERLLQWLRLSFLFAPPLVLCAYGTPALSYAVAMAAAVVVTFGWVALLLSLYPHLLVRWQLWLRVLDCGIVYLILVTYHAFLHNTYYDSAYVLFVVAGAITHGRRGALLISALGGVAVLAGRLQLIAMGALPFEARHVTDAAFYGAFFSITAVAVAFLMGKTAEVVQRREQAWRAELEESIQMRAATLTSVSHDLRTPLTVIRVHTQLARRLPDPGQIRLSLDQIDGAATRMSGWIDELLEASKSRSADDLQLDLRPTDLTALAQHAVTQHQQTTARHHLAMEGAAQPVVGSWDAERLERVLDNLLGNAVKFSPRGGRIGVSVANVGDWAELCVYDEGVGIPAKDLPLIFEPFKRGSNVARRITGTGIGLTSTRRIVEQHGGRLEVNSVEGRGSAFTVRLPLSSIDG